MSLNTIFALEALLVVVVVVAVVAGAGYLTLHGRRTQHGTGRRIGTTNVSLRVAHDEPAEGFTTGTTFYRRPRREFYKSMGLQTSEDMKLRLYSPAEYESELGGEGEVLSGIGFVAALKGYRRLDGEWREYPPRRVTEVLELGPGDYEVDRQRQALLLRRLPHGLPTSARDTL
jgi:hypothetical protein